MPKALGYSLYLSTFAAQCSALGGCSNSGTPLFLSLHISEEFDDSYCRRAEEICHGLADQGFQLIADVSVKTLQQFGCSDLVELAKKLDEDGHLPATFMVVAPGSWTDQVWDDINRMRTLNTNQTQNKRVMHVCPLQLDIVDRLINRYSNEGDLVLDPFGGLGTVALQALKAGRKGYTIELNNDYFRDAVGYLKDFETEEPHLFSMFDLI